MAHPIWVGEEDDDDMGYGAYLAEDEWDEAEGEF